MHRVGRAVSVIALFVAAVVPVAAHHGTSITYEVNKTITLTGVVTEFVYGYPHPQVYFDVTDESARFSAGAASSARRR